MTNFERCQVHVGISEGGANFEIVNGKPILKPNSRADRGGPTKYGITWGTLAAAYSQGIVDHSDITALTKTEANKIYEANYWRPSRSDKMQWPLCLCHYDCAVNAGVGGAAKQLQRAVNEIAGKNIVSIDGVIGPATLKAIDALDAKKLFDSYLSVRESFYRGLVAKTPSQGAFLNGWLKRLERVRKEAI